MPRGVPFSRVHGTRSRYDAGCRCKPCAAAKSAVARRHRSRHRESVAPFTAVLSDLYRRGESFARMAEVTGLQAATIRDIAMGDREWVWKATLDKLRQITVLLPEGVTVDAEFLPEDAEWCSQGHDVSEVGRTESRCCRECSVARSRAAHLRAKYGSNLPVRRLKQYARRRFNLRRGDSRAVRAALVAAWSSYRGCTEQSAERVVRRLFAKEMFTLAEADRWACALDTHLILIWPEVYPPGETFPDEEDVA